MDTLPIYIGDCITALDHGYSFNPTYKQYITFCNYFSLPQQWYLSHNLFHDLCKFPVRIHKIQSVLAEYLPRVDTSVDYVPTCINWTESLFYLLHGNYHPNRKESDKRSIIPLMNNTILMILGTCLAESPPTLMTPFQAREAISTYGLDKLNPYWDIFLKLMQPKKTLGIMLSILCEEYNSHPVIYWDSSHNCYRTTLEELYLYIKGTTEPTDNEIITKLQLNTSAFWYRSDLLSIVNKPVEYKYKDGKVIKGTEWLGWKEWDYITFCNSCIKHNTCCDPEGDTYSVVVGRYIEKQLPEGEVRDKYMDVLLSSI